MIYLKLNCISILSYSRKIGVSLISAIALSEFSETNTCNQRLYLEWKGICSNTLPSFTIQEKLFSFNCSWVWKERCVCYVG